MAMFVLLMALIFRDARIDLQQQNEKRRKLAPEMIAAYSKEAAERTARQIEINRRIMEHESK
jgi:hypothetical protein